MIIADFLQYQQHPTGFQVSCVQWQLDDSGYFWWCGHHTCDTGHNGHMEHVQWSLGYHLTSKIIPQVKTASKY